jgi:NADPH:quinone reductase-like Zn-dependent oxidoreductase
MRAYVLAGFDTPPEIMEVPTPGIGPDDVLVRVLASSVNPHDAHVISGAAKAYMDYRFPITLGNDVAGVIEEIGRGVTRFQPGDKVFGVLRETVAHRGTFAEYVAVPADVFLVGQPPNLSDIDAGALGLATVAALACLETVAVSRGDAVLINGATGGVGGSAIQISAAAGFRVVATARPGDEERHVRSLGATDVVDWSAGDVAGRVRELCPHGIDGLIDLVNFDPSAFDALAAAVLRQGGRAASTLNAAQPDRREGLIATNVVAMAKPRYLDRMAAMAASGALCAPVKEVYDLEHIDDALAALAAGALGKIAVRVAGRSPA